MGSDVMNHNREIHFEIIDYLNNRNTQIPYNNICYLYYFAILSKFKFNTHTSHRRYFQISSMFMLFIQIIQIEVRGKRTQNQMRKPIDQ